MMNPLQMFGQMFSQISQTQDLIGQLQPVSKPAYITYSPYVTNCGGCNC